MAEVPLTGKIARERIISIDIPRPDPAVVAAFLALTDLAGTVSDAMDELGIHGAVPAAKLQPMLPGARMVGPALTVRNISADKLLMEAKIVPSGVAEVARLQAQEGFVYLKP